MAAGAPCRTSDRTSRRERDDVIRRGWTLGAGLAGVDQRGVAEHGIDDGPGGADAVGARGNVHG